MFRGPDFSDHEPEEPDVPQLREEPDAVQQPESPDLDTPPEGYRRITIGYPSKPEYQELSLDVGANGVLTPESDEAVRSALSDAGIPGHVSPNPVKDLAAVTDFTPAQSFLDDPQDYLATSINTLKSVTAQGDLAPDQAVGRLTEAAGTLRHALSYQAEVLDHDELRAQAQRFVQDASGVMQKLCDATAEDPNYGDLRPYAARAETQELADEARTVHENLVAGAPDSIEGFEAHDKFVEGRTSRADSLRGIVQDVGVDYAPDPLAGDPFDEIFEDSLTDGEPRPNPIDALYMETPQDTLTRVGRAVENPYTPPSPEEISTDPIVVGFPVWEQRSISESRRENTVTVEPISVSITGRTQQDAEGNTVTTSVDDELESTQEHVTRVREELEEIVHSRAADAPDAAAARESSEHLQQVEYELDRARHMPPGAERAGLVEDAMRLLVTARDSAVSVLDGVADSPDRPQPQEVLLEDGVFRLMAGEYVHPVGRSPRAMPAPTAEANRSLLEYWLAVYERHVENPEYSTAHADVLRGTAEKLRARVESTPDRGSFTPVMDVSYAHLRREEAQRAAAAEQHAQQHKSSRREGGAGLGRTPAALGAVTAGVPEPLTWHHNPALRGVRASTLHPRF